MKKSILGLAVVGAIAIIAAVLTVNLTGGSSNHDTVSLAALAPVDDGADQGIKVRGQWTIEIREPDGKFVSRYGFENALTFNGAAMLTKLLARSGSTGKWSIQAYDDTPRPDRNSPCVFPGGDPSSCIITEPPGVDRTNSFYNASVQIPLSGPNRGKLVLSGYFTAGRDGAVINTVRMGYTLCIGTIAPADCPTALPVNSTSGDFTETKITPVEIQNGQQVLITVVISFS